VIVDTSASTTTPNHAELWTIRGLVARHKLAALGLAAACAVMLALILVPLIGARSGGGVSDATTCTGWGSTNQAKQTAYARLYLREHGSLPDGATSTAHVVAAINTGCMQSFGDGVSDTTTVVQAISGNF
jgi:hypothetical protein